MIDRTITTKLLELSAKYPVTVLSGPRQSGKTTLLKALFPTLPYANLEDPDVRNRALADPRLFLQHYPGGALLDEAQRVPELFSYLQGIVDNDRNIHFILSGSQHFLLMEKVTQSLAGRAAILKLLPFSMEELKSAQLLPPTLEEILYQGMFPAIYDRQYLPGDFYPSYLETYVERDVRQVKNIGNLNDFIRFMRLCAGRVGQLLNISSLATDAGISPNTAKAWLSILEASFVVFQVLPHHRNFNKRLVKTPKLYFYDTGLACSLLFIEHADQLLTHHQRGALFENFIVAEMLKKRFHAAKTSNLYFWRDNHGNEVDLLLETADQLTPIEIKSGMTQNTAYFKGLDYWHQLAGTDPQSGFVIYGGNETVLTTQGKLVSWRELGGRNDWAY